MYCGLRPLHVVHREAPCHQGGVTMTQGWSSVAGWEGGRDHLSDPEGAAGDLRCARGPRGLADGGLQGLQSDPP